MGGQLATVLRQVGEGTGITPAIHQTPMGGGNTSMAITQVVMEEASNGAIGVA